MTDITPALSPDSRMDKTSNDREALLARLVFILLAAAAPLFAVLTFPPTQDNYWLRFFSTPVLAIEVLVIGCALLDGFRPMAAFRQLRPFTRIAALAWLAVALLATLAAQSEPIVARLLMLTSFVHALLGLALYDRLRNGRLISASDTQRALAIGALLYLAVAALFVASAWQTPEFNWAYFGAGVSNLRQIGYYGLTLTGLAAGMIAATRARPTTYALLFAGWFLVEWCGGRASFGAAVAGTALLVLLARGRRWRIALASLACLLAAIPLSIAAAPSPLWGASASLTRAAAPDGQKMGENYTSGRAEIWAGTWEGIADRPILGHGEGQFRHQVAEAYGFYNHPHNGPLQLLYQWGFAGTLALLAMLGGVALALLRQPIERLRPVLPAIGAASSLLAMSLLDGALYYVFPVMVLVVCVALCAAAASKPEKAAPVLDA